MCLTDRFDLAVLHQLEKTVFNSTRSQKSKIRIGDRSSKIGSPYGTK
jgi:hypothetical protein